MGKKTESCLGRGIAQMYKYALTKGNKYRQAALSTLDYFFGRNATDYCYLTGFGTQRVMNIHTVSLLPTISRSQYLVLWLEEPTRDRKMPNSYQPMLPIFQMNPTRITLAAMPQTRLTSTGTPTWCPSLDG